MTITHKLWTTRSMKLINHHLKTKCPDWWGAKAVRQRSRVTCPTCLAALAALEEKKGT